MARQTLCSMGPAMPKRRRRDLRGRAELGSRGGQELFGDTFQRGVTGRGVDALEDGGQATIPRMSRHVVDRQSAVGAADVACQDRHVASRRVRVPGSSAAAALSSQKMVTGPGRCAMRAAGSDAFRAKDVGQRARLPRARHQEEHVARLEQRRVGERQAVGAEGGDVHGDGEPLVLRRARSCRGRATPYDRRDRDRARRDRDEAGRPPAEPARNPGPPRRDRGPRRASGIRSPEGTRAGSSRVSRAIR